MKNFIYAKEEAIIGLGTNSIRDLPSLTSYLLKADKLKYDFVDCAWRYGNEAIIGLALKNIKRDDMSFLLTLKFQSKVWNSQYSGGIAKSLKFTLQKIGAISQMESYMLHIPAEDLKVNLTAFKQLLDCKRNRLTKKIGLANFELDLINKLFISTNFFPDFLQYNISINNMRRDKIEFCFKNKINLQACNPYGDYEKNLNNPIIKKISEKHNCSVKNLLISFLLHNGIVVIATPANKEDIVQIIKAKEITLTKEEVEELWTINDDNDISLNMVNI